MNCRFPFLLEQFVRFAHFLQRRFPTFLFRTQKIIQMSQYINLSLQPILNCYFSTYFFCLLLLFLSLFFVSSHCLSCLDLIAFFVLISLPFIVYWSHFFLELHVWNLNWNCYTVFSFDSVFSTSDVNKSYAESQIITVSDARQIWKKLKSW